MAATPASPDAAASAGGDSSARPRPCPPGRTDDWVLATIQEHAASLLSTARRHSLCRDDAQDAYQRAIEIFIRRADRLERGTVAGWLHTVVKHEAHTVRDERQRLLYRTAYDLDLREAADLPTTDEHIDRLDRIAHAAEALQRIKPAELRALVLRAEGHSYAEIEAISGWSYTKVNRLLSEGRRRLRDRYTEIESGEECSRWSSVLSAMADGEADANDLIAIRPHLRSCRGCQALLRVYGGAPSDVQALVPIAALGAGATAPGRSGHLLTRIYEVVAGGFHERATLSAAKLQAGVEAASAGKVAAVAASAVAVAGGGAAVVEQAATPVHDARVVASKHRNAAPIRTTTTSAAANQPAGGVLVRPPAPRGNSVSTRKTSTVATTAAAKARAADAAAASEFGFEDGSGQPAAEASSTPTAASHPSTPAAQAPASTPEPAAAAPATAPAPSDGAGEFGP